MPEERLGRLLRALGGLPKPLPESKMEPRAEEPTGLWKPPEDVEPTRVWKAPEAAEAAETSVAPAPSAASDNEVTQPRARITGQPPLEFPDYSEAPLLPPLPERRFDMPPVDVPRDAQRPAEKPGPGPAPEGEADGVFSEDTPLSFIPPALATLQSANVILPIPAAGLARRKGDRLPEPPSHVELAEAVGDLLEEAPAARDTKAAKLAVADVESVAPELAERHRETSGAFDLSDSEAEAVVAAIEEAVPGTLLPPPELRAREAEKEPPASEFEEHQKIADSGEDISLLDVESAEPPSAADLAPRAKGRALEAEDSSLSFIEPAEEMVGLDLTSEACELREDSAASLLRPREPAPPPTPDVQAEASARARPARRRPGGVDAPEELEEISGVWESDRTFAELGEQIGAAEPPPKGMPPVPADAIAAEKEAIAPPRPQLGPIPGWSPEPSPLREAVLAVAGKRKPADAVPVSEILDFAEAEQMLEMVAETREDSGLHVIENIECPNPNCNGETPLDIATKDRFCGWCGTEFTDLPAPEPVAAAPFARADAAPDFSAMGQGEIAEAAMRPGASTDFRMAALGEIFFRARVPGADAGAVPTPAESFGQVFGILGATPDDAKGEVKKALDGLMNDGMRASFVLALAGEGNDPALERESLDFLSWRMAHAELDSLARAKSPFVRSEAGRLLQTYYGEQTPEEAEFAKSEEQRFYAGLASFRAGPQSPAAAAELESIIAESSERLVPCPSVLGACGAIIQSAEGAEDRVVARQKAARALFTVLAAAGARKGDSVEKAKAHRIARRLKVEIAPWSEDILAGLGSTGKLSVVEKAMLGFAQRSMSAERMRRRTPVPEPAEAEAPSSEPAQAEELAPVPEGEAEEPEALSEDEKAAKLAASFLGEEVSLDDILITAQCPNDDCDYKIPLEKLGNFCPKCGTQMSTGRQPEDGPAMALPSQEGRTAPPPTPAEAVLEAEAEAPPLDPAQAAELASAHALAPLPLPAEEVAQALQFPDFTDYTGEQILAEAIRPDATSETVLAGLSEIITRANGELSEIARERARAEALYPIFTIVGRMHGDEARAAVKDTLDSWLTDDWMVSLQLALAAPSRDSEAEREAFNFLRKQFGRANFAYLAESSNVFVSRESRRMLELPDPEVMDAERQRLLEKFGEALDAFRNAPASPLARATLESVVEYAVSPAVATETALAAAEAIISAAEAADEMPGDGAKARAAHALFDMLIRVRDDDAKARQLRQSFESSLGRPWVDDIYQALSDSHGLDPAQRAMFRFAWGSIPKEGRMLLLDHHHAELMDWPGAEPGETPEQKERRKKSDNEAVDLYRFLSTKYFTRQHSTLLAEHAKNVRVRNEAAKVRDGLSTVMSTIDNPEPPRPAPKVSEEPAVVISPEAHAGAVEFGDSDPTPIVDIVPEPGLNIPRKGVPLAEGPTLEESLEHALDGAPAHRPERESQELVRRLRRESEEATGVRKKPFGEGLPEGAMSTALLPGRARGEEAQEEAKLREELAARSRGPEKDISTLVVRDSVAQYRVATPVQEQRKRSEHSNVWVLFSGANEEILEVHDADIVEVINAPGAESPADREDSKLFRVRDEKRPVLITQDGAKVYMDMVQQTLPEGKKVQMAYALEENVPEDIQRHFPPNKTRWLLPEGSSYPGYAVPLGTVFLGGPKLVFDQKVPGAKSLTCVQRTILQDPDNPGAFAVRLVGSMRSDVSTMEAFTDMKLRDQLEEATPRFITGEDAELLRKVAETRGLSPRRMESALINLRRRYRDIDCAHKELTPAPVNPEEARAISSMLTVTKVLDVAAGLYRIYQPQLIGRHEHNVESMRRLTWELESPLSEAVEECLVRLEPNLRDAVKDNIPEKKGLWGTVAGWLRGKKEGSG